jgi:hypothetical protein
VHYEAEVEVGAPPLVSAHGMHPLEVRNDQARGEYPIEMPDEHEAPGDEMVDEDEAPLAAAAAAPAEPVVPLPPPSFKNGLYFFCF